MKDRFSWKSKGKVFPIAPVRLEKKFGGSNRIKIRKMFDAEREKKVTDKLSEYFRNLATINTRGKEPEIYQNLARPQSTAHPR